MTQHIIQTEDANPGVASSHVSDHDDLVDDASLDVETVPEFAITSGADDLAALLQQEQSSRRKDLLATFGLTGVFLWLTLWMTNNLFISPDVTRIMTNIKICCALMFSIGGAMCLGCIVRSYRRKRGLIDVLSGRHDIQQVVPLIQALRVENTSARNLTKEALTRLLPRLQASDSPLLGEAERRTLLRQLAISPNDHGYRDLTELFSRSAYRREVDLRVAILSALRQVGGPRELAAVVRLSRGLPTIHSASKVPIEVREAAKESLPFLQYRAGEQRASEQLLRASSIQDLRPDTLLRPAVSQPDAPDHLLRPVVE